MAPTSTVTSRGLVFHYLLERGWMLCPAAFESCAAGPSIHLHEGKTSMGKGNNSQKNDKKNKKVKQDSKKVAAKPANKK